MASTDSGEDIPFANRTEYTAFLMLHAAYADLEYTSDERIKILDIVNEEKLVLLERFYESHTDSLILELLRRHSKSYFPTEAEREVLFDQIKSFFKADGEYSKLESNLLLFLDHLFE